MNKQASNLLLLGLKTIIRQPKLIQLIFFWLPFVSGSALIVGGGFYLYETNIARPQMSYMGVPTTQNNWQNMTHVLRNKAYMLSYSERLANPLWVTYKVTNQTQKYGKRPPFTTDWRTLNRVSAKDYKFTGYNRGHLAPNYVIASRYGRYAQKEAFKMTNISPQKPKFNQKIWQRLEHVAAKKFSKQFETFWVVTGPIFSKHPKMLKNTNIAIPQAFYKIFITPKNGLSPPQALAFIMPQTAKPNDSLIKYVTSIDEIEKQTGIDFFWQLDDKIEQKIESEIKYKSWKLQKVANLPSRY